MCAPEGVCQIFRFSAYESEQQIFRELAKYLAAGINTWLPPK